MKIRNVRSDLISGYSTTLPLKPTRASNLCNGEGSPVYHNRTLYKSMRCSNPSPLSVTAIPYNQSTRSDDPCFVMAIPNIAWCLSLRGGCLVRDDVYLGFA